MMDTPIKGFFETSSPDRPGLVCVVISLPYCNLRCPYCHSHKLILEPDSLETIPVELILEQLEPKRDRIDRISITGGEPTIHHGLPSLLKTIQEAGFKTELDTNGTQPEILEYLISKNLVDYVSMDVKAPLDDSAYARCAGVFVPVSIIQKSIEVLLAADVPSIFQCTVVPSLLAEGDIYRLAEQLKGLRPREIRLSQPATARHKWAGESDGQQAKGRVGPYTAPALTLQTFDPTDPMEPSLKGVTPFTDEVISRMQNEVNGILGYRL